MPDRVRIGGMVYHVVAYTLRQSLEHDRLGECRSDVPDIAVGDWLSPPIAADVLWHEIIHGVCYRWALPENSSEEVVVDTIAKGLMAVFSDNPELVAWTQAVLRDQSSGRFR